MSSASEANEQNIRAIRDLIGARDFSRETERERLLWLLVLMHAGALTPRSEDEKVGMERVLAILDRKLSEGGCANNIDHNRYYRGRWSAFQECAIMLRSALTVHTHGQGEPIEPQT